MKWIKHDTDANQDAKLQNVLLDYGLEGYGLFWYCIELIAGKVDKDNITFDLEHDARIIARNTGSTVQRVEEMMRYFVVQGLFENTEGVVTCLKLSKRLDQSMTSNPEMRIIIDKLKNHDGVMTKSDKVMQDKIRLDKNKDNSYPAGINPDLLVKISEAWNTKMKTQPSIKLLDETQVNKKRWSKIKKIIVDNPNYLSYEYWEGHIDQLSTHPDLQWQRDNRQLTFDQVVQIDKFERNLGLMRMIQQ
jgi:hypothetical protein